MTPQDHNKILGIMHLLYGGFNALMMVIFIPFFLAIGGLAATDPGSPPGLGAIFGALGVLMLALALAFGLPPILAGYAMLKGKRWARTAGIVAACFEALSFPFGTALCVYTFWFLFGQGEGFHRQGGGRAFRQGWQPPHLRDAGAYEWEAQRAQQSARQREYVPPPQPPDWRGQ
ncbi:MAG TPA: hypothetical protein VF659_16275 [Pyrinomonadaceae bacterium]|jgi:hypothetical protein